MILISHRGNINGIVEDRENRPSYIDAALQLSYDVEIDIRLINDEFWLGHDEPQYKVDLNWLNLRKKNLWLHCKDGNSATEFSKLKNGFNFFCHSSDPYVLISNNMLWVHDLKGRIDTNCIIPLLSEKDINDYDNDIPYAICTDFPVLIKKTIMNKKKTQIIIPMSGIGERFLSSGYKEPKPLIVVDGKPIIEHVVGIFDNPEDVIFICNEIHLEKTNMVEVLKRISPRCKIISVPNENRKGPVDAILKASDYINDKDEIIISYCDYGTVWDFDAFLKIKDNYDGLIPSYIGFHPHMLGSDNYAFSKIENDLVVEIREKQPFTDNKMNEYASNGTYYFKSGKIVKKYFKELIENDMNVNGEYYVSLVYNLLIRDGLKVGVFEIEKMLQWGTPYDLEVYKGWSKYFNNFKTWSLTATCPKNTTLILPMAGKGSRFSDMGYDKPKPILPVNNNPMIIEAVNCLPKTDNKTFITLSEHVTKYHIDSVLTEKYNGCNVIEIDSVTEGQACTCEIGVNKSCVDLENPILISASDNGILYNNIELQKLLDDENIDIIVWTFRNNQSSKISPNSYAWLDVDDSGQVKHVSCKKFIYDDPLKTHAIVGTMFFRKSKYFMDGLKKNYENNIRINNEFYVDDVLNQNIKQGLTVKVFEVENYICWGTPNDLKTYEYWKNYFYPEI